MRWKENQNQARRSDCCGDGRRRSSWSYSTPTPSGSVLLGQLHELEPYLAHARMDQADFPGDTIGYINFAPFLIGTPVIDTYKLELPAAGVHHADEGSKRQIGMCRCEGLTVEGLTIRSLATVKPGTIPAGIAHPSLNWLHRLIQMRD